MWQLECENKDFSRQTYAALINDWAKSCHIRLPLNFGGTGGTGGTVGYFNGLMVPPWVKPCATNIAIRIKFPHGDYSKDEQLALPNFCLRFERVLS